MLSFFTTNINYKNSSDMCYKQEITGELLNKVSYIKVNTNVITDFLTREPGKTNQ
jgi:hypothetical protein